jgi:uncharacterized protein YndB with AHSA1/START domain
VDSTADGIVVVREVAIAARPETVWEFLVDPDKLVRWMGVAASIQPRPGGVYSVEVVPGNVARGEVVEVDRPRRLVVTWGWDPASNSPVPAGSTAVEFELLTDPNGTLLRLTHRRLPDSAAASSHADGWGHYLVRLASVAIGAEPGTDPWIKGRRRP